jgi:type IV secretory pathway VirB10-like protein
VAKPPHIRRLLAHSLAAQANAVAQALAQTDGCTALAHANELRDAVAQAVSANEIPVRLRAKLTAAVNDLPGRITCNPAPPPPPPEKTKPPKHDHGHGHGHGEGDG